MEKFEHNLGNPSETVAVLEREENKEEMEKKTTALAEEYLSFNNNETKLEKDLSDMLKKINSLEKTNSSSEFLKGQICLELYEIYKNSPDASVGTPPLHRSKEKNVLADICLEQANENFLESVKGEDFEITVKNKEGKEITFADKSHSFAYLGDIAAKDFYEQNNKADWDKSLRYYKEAIEAEPDDGKKHELKTIMDIRKITHYLGDESKLKVWKTPRRIDLRGGTADFSLQYTGDKNEIVNKNIDATLRNDKNKQWSDTAVLSLDKKIIDFLAEIDFNNLLKEASEKGELSEKNKRVFGNTIDYATVLAEKLEKAMEDEIKSSEKLNFRKMLYLNPDKLVKFSKFASAEKLSGILSE